LIGDQEYDNNVAIRTEIYHLCSLCCGHITPPHLNELYPIQQIYRWWTNVIPHHEENTPLDMISKLKICYFKSRNMLVWDKLEQKLVCSWLWESDVEIYLVTELSRLSDHNYSSVGVYQYVTIRVPDWALCLTVPYLLDMYTLHVIALYLTVPILLNYTLLCLAVPAP